MASLPPLAGGSSLALWRETSWAGLHLPCAPHTPHPYLSHHLSIHSNSTSPQAMSLMWESVWPAKPSEGGQGLRTPRASFAFHPFFPPLLLLLIQKISDSNK